jgi:hypothetical protein
VSWISNPVFLKFKKKKKKKKEKKFYHGATFGEVDKVGFQVGLVVGIVRAPPIDPELLYELVDVALDGAMGLNSLFCMFLPHWVTFQHRKFLLLWVCLPSISANLLWPWRSQVFDIFDRSLKILVLLNLLHPRIQALLG